jgi:hypothetical protein
MSAGVALVPAVFRSLCFTAADALGGTAGFARLESAVDCCGFDVFEQPTAASAASTTIVVT